MRHAAFPHGYLHEAKVIQGEVGHGILTRHHQTGLCLRSGDPCGYLSLTLQNDNQWKISSVPDLRSTRSDEEHKLVVIEKLKTEQFVFLINKYFEQHPELDLKVARQIRRELLFLKEDDVTIHGRRIIISIQDTANVSMLCTENGLILADIKTL